MIDIKPHNILTTIKEGLELTVPDVVAESTFDHEEWEMQAPDGTSVIISRDIPLYCTPMPDDVEGWRNVRFILADFGSGLSLLVRE
jgi:hypothetical protein